MSNFEAAAMRSMNRIAKWRTIFAGWQLGTRAKGDPEGDAVRDHREVTILLRCENNALVQLLAAKGVFTVQEWQHQLGVEADHLEAEYRERFPGAESTDSGMAIDLRQASGWMKDWKP